ncbi:MAG TPA: PQQ-binding-like beta-propeller repeat protein, partial [Gemmatimonadales bacterium]|nr:PQQ-binding-like beta-propeller repeat protein [Gemmatimonadales bacterium]
MSRRTLVALAMLTALASCAGPDRVVDPPSLAISDGATGGNAHFYFLPPLVPRPSPTGVFDPTLEPIVRITANGSPLMDLPATPSAADEHYHVNWHTNGAGLNPRVTYRLTVLAEGVALGFADVIVLPNGKGLKNINTGEYVGLADGRTLPIKFRIEKGAIPEGALLWSFVSGGTTSSPARGPDGSIYAGSVDGRLYALAPDGTVRWSYVFPSPVFATPTIGADGTIYTASDDAYFYALNPNGTLKWRFLLGTGVRSSPALAADGAIYVGAGRFLWALNPDGTLRWRYATGGNNASPAVGADGTVYAGAWDRYVYAINPNGTLKWRHLTGGTVFLSSPALGADGAVYIGSEDWSVYALNADGTLRWRYFTNAGVFSSPALGADGTVYVGSADGWLYALRPDGTLRWRFQTGGEV